MRCLTPVVALAAFVLAACAENPTAPLASEPVQGISAAGLTTSFQQAPRPGCGFGDNNHTHQAAPGQDPLGLRPGKGKGDTNHPHTAPPGQAPVGGGVQGDPMRGCKADPKGL